MDTEARDKFTKARAGLVLDQPFFASLSLRLKVEEDTTCQTMWTDGVNLQYNPDFVKGLTLDQLKGVICHEVMHNALNHNLRQGERDHEDWNISGDYAINPIIEDSGLTLPPERLRDPNYDNQEAEAIYPKIHRPRPKGKGQQGQGKGDPDKGQCGEVRPFPSPTGKEKATPSEIAQQEQNQKIATQQALTVARQCGTLPAGLERLIDQLLEPVIDWREVLSRFIDQNSRNDYTWTAPNRRYSAFDMYLPALQNTELGNILIAIDTSGSIQQRQLTEFLSEARGILKTYDNTTLTIVFCDADIQGDPITIDTETEIELIKPQGGGGTSFRPPFEWTEAEAIQPKACVYFTDGYCNDFPAPPIYETLWILTHKNECFNPPFGEVIYMER